MTIALYGHTITLWPYRRSLLLQRDACVVLCYTVLCYAILCYAILCCAVLRLVQMRLRHNPREPRKTVTYTVVVFDMQHLTMFLNVFSVQFLKRMIHIDQHYYPETLYRLFVINAPVSRRRLVSLLHIYIHIYMEVFPLFFNLPCWVLILSLSLCLSACMYVL